MSTRERLAQFKRGVYTDPLARLFEVTSELISLYIELAMLQASEREQKIRAYADAPETSSTARDRAADYATLELSSEILKLKGEILAYQEERDFLKVLIAAKGELNGQDDGPTNNESSRPS